MEAQLLKTILYLFKRFTTGLEFFFVCFFQLGFLNDSFLPKVDYNFNIIWGTSRGPHSS